MLSNIFPCYPIFSHANQYFPTLGKLWAAEGSRRTAKAEACWCSGGAALLSETERGCGLDQRERSYFEGISIFWWLSHYIIKKIKCENFYTVLQLHRHALKVVDKHTFYYPLLSFAISCTILCCPHPSIDNKWVKNVLKIFWRFFYFFSGSVIL